MRYQEKSLIRKNTDSTVPYLEFAPLLTERLAHRFTLRGKNPETFPNSPLFPFPTARHVQAEQVHGGVVSLVTSNDHDTVIPQSDALITKDKNLILTIRTADCGPVYFYDPVRQAIGLAHSGKKGTALNITGSVIKAMRESFGSDPADLIVVLGPCIRPPDYDIDFAVDITAQAKGAGVKNYYDCGLNTASDLKQFYSYRMELGKTGRHYAFLMLNR